MVVVVVVEVLLFGVAGERETRIPLPNNDSRSSSTDLLTTGTRTTTASPSSATMLISSFADVVDVGIGDVVVTGGVVVVVVVVDVGGGAGAGSFSGSRT